jgi:hypothetical protein
VEISFQESFDDLDEGYFALLEFTESFSVILKDYPEAPVKGTRICTDPNGQRSTHRLEIILEAVHLSHDRLIWTVDGLGGRHCAHEPQSHTEDYAHRDRNGQLADSSYTARRVPSRDALHAASGPGRKLERSSQGHHCGRTCL